MDNKKLIAGFGYQEGRISSWDGKRTYTQAVPQMAKHCCDTVSYTHLCLYNKYG